jgi:hypothetical protein
MIYGTIALIILLVFLGLQVNRDGRQDQLINESTTYTLLETGSCQVIRGVYPYTLIPSVIFKYKLYSNQFKSYVTLESNTSFIPIDSIFKLINFDCSDNIDYVNLLNIFISNCTTESSGIINHINNIVWFYTLAANFLKSEQEKFVIQNNTDSIFTDPNFLSKCRGNQLAFSIYSDPDTGIHTNAFMFSILLKNMSTGFSLSSPITVSLAQSLI